MTSDPVLRYQMEKAGRMNRLASMRPLQANEAVDTAIRLFQLQGWKMLKLSALPALLSAGAIQFFFTFVLERFFITAHPESTALQLQEAIVALGLTIFVAAPIFFIGVACCWAYVSSIVGDFLLGRVPDEKAAQMNLNRTIWPLVKSSVRELLFASSGLFVATLSLGVASYLNKSGSPDDTTAGLAGLIGIGALIIGTILFFVLRINRALTAPVIVYEGLSPKAAAKRSSYLMKSRDSLAVAHAIWFRSAVVCAIVAVALGGGYGIIAGFGLQKLIYSFTSGLFVQGVLQAVFALLPAFTVLWFVIPIWCTAMTLLYYDRRIRLEGYDIEALAQEVWRSDRTARFQL